jgi:hypothetical protein
MNASTNREETQIKSTRTRVVLIGGVVPIAMALVATILMLTWLPELPDPIAVHWNGSGVDGFGTAIPFVYMPAVITMVFSGFAVAWSWRPNPSGLLNWNQKVILTTSVWLAVLLSIGFGASIALQRGLVDAQDAPNVGPALAIAAGIGVVAAAAAWFLLPAGESVNVSGVDPKPVDVQGDERVSWSHTTALSTAPLIVISIVILLALAATVTSLVVVPAAVLAGVIIILVVLLLALTSFWWRVTTDSRGFLVRGVFGVPRKRIPLSDIRKVTVVDINPGRDFGGWGWRWAPEGRTGIIVKSGPGIEVTRENGKRFVVTVDDAATGAGVLAALVARKSRA